MKRKEIVIILLMMFLILTSCGVKEPDSDIQSGEYTGEPDNTYNAPATDDKNNNQDVQPVDTQDLSVETSETLARVEELRDLLKSPELCLVNTENPLSWDFAPEELIKFEGYDIGIGIHEHLTALIKAARDAGHSNLRIYSAYRSYEKQKINYNNKVSEFISAGLSRKDAEAEAATIVAIPGSSEHQYGYCADICTPAIVNRYNGKLHESFEETDEFKWLDENAADYGFVIRYGKDKQEITGITYEPWHYRYVGIENAKNMKEKNLCLEEYIELLQNELKKLGG